jgi:hypothetical protein
VALFLLSAFEFVGGNWNPQAALEAPGCFPLCFRAFAEAMEVACMFISPPPFDSRRLQVIPSTLAENSGMHPISLVTELR